MCGIYATFGQSHPTPTHADIAHRGPDNCAVHEEPNVYMAFHRLAIMDPTAKGNQPILNSRFAIICNGEIYNWEILKWFYGADKFQNSSYPPPSYKSNSDCEVLLQMAHAEGVWKGVKRIEGVFAFVVYDREYKTVTVARDHVGVRPLFCAITPNTAAFCSEAKALKAFGKIVRPFPPGSVMSFRLDQDDQDYQTTKLSNFRWNSFSSTPCPLPLASLKMPNGPHAAVRAALEGAVEYRTQSDRPLGCLLSGGLDSSLVAAILQSITDHPLQTFSIGMKGATDLQAAQEVATHIESHHHHVELDKQEFLDAIPDVIRAIESYDVTTVRASVGMYLLAKYIRTNTDIKVIFSGEGADEVCQGYIYFHNQPTLKCGDEESRRLIKDLHYYDVLRADRTTAAWGLELRVPFLDPDFVNLYLALPEHLRAPIDGFEKHTLRKAFDSEDEKVSLLPHNILWRPKEAFSDGCSSSQESWHSIIQKEAEKHVTDLDLEEAKVKYPHNTPRTKEALWFRNVFAELYPDMDHLIPYQWMPKWVGENICDPSARELSHYK